jgi:hypothetical protein
MMSETTLLESRVDKLEQDNRRLKLTVGALLLVMAAVPLIGAVMPEQVQEVIRARSFEVIDENGTDRVGMGENGIFYRDRSGQLRQRMNLAGDGISFHDDNGTIRARVEADGIGYWDENENLVWRTPER